ncbi:hypothetical protein IH979_02990 [Patescibacteria group bacterium]|nr:hypothetical protein [Patescibacteria group bacterium]
MATISAVFEGIKVGEFFVARFHDRTFTLARKGSEDDACDLSALGLSLPRAPPSSQKYLVEQYVAYHCENMTGQRLTLKYVEAHHPCTLVFVARRASLKEMAEELLSA